MPTSATLAFAKLLDLALVKAFDQGYELVKDTASAPLHSAATELRKEQAGREQRLAAIVQKAAEIALPGLRELEAQPGWPYATILEHRQFLNAVVEQLLVGGQPDPQQLRRYVEATVGPEAWRQMGEPLLRFVDEIERQLRQDSLWAEPLSAFRIAWLMEGLPVKLLRIAAPSTPPVVGAWSPRPPLHAPPVVGAWSPRPPLHAPPVVGAWSPRPPPHAPLSTLPPS
ncbi:MAG: hypothetical protein K1X65_16630 [Caldilineales bacterium]|nr:hypothetical protein [Caldilineales bacterium]